jgi:hypothetical protein
MIDFNHPEFGVGFLPDRFVWRHWDEEIESVSAAERSSVLEVCSWIQSLNCNEMRWHLILDG